MNLNCATYDIALEEYKENKISPVAFSFCLKKSTERQSKEFNEKVKRIQYNLLTNDFV